MYYSVILRFDCILEGVIMKCECTLEDVKLRFDQAFNTHDTPGPSIHHTYCFMRSNRALSNTGL